MPQAARKAWSYEAIVAEGLDPKLYEVIEGDLVPVKVLSMGGSALHTRLAHLVNEHVEAHRLGVVYTVGRFLLRREPRLERRPDLAFLALARFPAHDPDLVEVAPDLVIEVVSPSDPSAAAFDRASRDLEAGVREHWVVDPKFRTIVVLRPNLPPRPLGVGDTIESPEILPGFRLELERLFARPGA